MTRLKRNGLGLAGIDDAVVCMYGHVINALRRTLPEYNTEFCQDCGQPAVVSCDSDLCGKPIIGCEIGSNITNWQPPSYCHACGRPYPWTVRKSKRLTDLLAEIEELDANDRAKLIESVPDLMADTAKSEVAVIRYRIVLLKLKKTVSELLKKTLGDICTEAVKKSIGL